MKRAIKPPLGVKPRFVWDAERLQDLKDAMIRALSANWPLEPEWIEEYEELISRLPIGDGKD